MPEETKETKKVSKSELEAQIKDMVGASIKDTLEGLKEDKQFTQMFNINTGAEEGKEKELSKTEQGVGAARFVRSLAAAKGDVEKAGALIKRSRNGDDRVSKVLLGEIEKSLQAGDFTAGGALLPDVLAPGLIELLRSRTVVRRAGARTLPMNNGRLTLRKQTGTASGSYVGESQNISKTEPTTGQIVMTAKKLAAIVPISNDLLRFDADISADEFVRSDLVQSLSRTEDTAFIRYDGTQDRPKGIRYWASSSNVNATNGTSASNVELDFKEMIDALESSDVMMDRPAFFMHPRSKNHLLNLRDANGNLVYPEIRNAQPTVYEIPVYTTTNIPKNLGAGSDESEIYLVDMDHAVIAEAQNMMITVDSSASYVESGSLVSAFSRDETAVRLIMEHDFALRHAEAAAVQTGIKWGA